MEKSSAERIAELEHQLQIFKTVCASLRSENEKLRRMHRQAPKIEITFQGGLQFAHCEPEWPCRKCFQCQRALSP